MTIKEICVMSYRNKASKKKAGGITERYEKNVEAGSPVLRMELWALSCCV